MVQLRQTELKKPKHFLFVIKTNFLEKGYNRRIVVYATTSTKERPIEVGENQVNTGSYRGDEASAKEVIKEAFGYKMTDDYNLDNKAITIFEL